MKKELTASGEIQTAVTEHTPISLMSGNIV